MTGLTTSCDDDEDKVEICNNSIDDDGDGLVDCKDEDCGGFVDCGIQDTRTRKLSGELASMTLYPDTVYTISRFTYVPSGETLTILPGTLIKAETGDGASASALIIARGGTIIAKGTVTSPIIFTSVDDNILPGQNRSTLDVSRDAGKWGGLIVLGNAMISATEDNGGDETAIEGVPKDFEFAQYGGNDNDDNSGILKFISIRFTGTRLGNNEEVQGLTLGGVGSETIIENIEVISSNDDGIEIFGGAVNVFKAMVSYQADDGLDLDQSYRGTIDNSMVAVYNPEEGNDAIEIDGPEGSLNAGGKFTITNCTFINKGNGDCRAGRMKSGAQGVIENSSFVDFNKWLLIDGGNTVANYQNGDLNVRDCDFNIDNISDAIGASEAQEDITSIFLSQTNGNSAVSNSNKGSSADFSWTLSAELGVIEF